MAVVTGVVQNRPVVSLFGDLFSHGVVLLVQQTLQFVDAPLGRAVVQGHLLAYRVLLGHVALAPRRRILFRVVGCVQLQHRNVLVSGPGRMPRK